MPSGYPRFPPPGDPKAEVLLDAQAMRALPCARMGRGRVDMGLWFFTGSRYFPPLRLKLDGPRRTIDREMEAVSADIRCGNVSFEKPRKWPFGSI